MFVQCQASLLSQLMILLEDDLPGALPIGQVVTFVSFKIGVTIGEILTVAIFYCIAIVHTDTAIVLQ